MQVIFSDIPFPPSVNSAYRPHKKTIVKSKKLADYKKAFKAYFYSNYEKFNQEQKHFSDLGDTKLVLELSFQMPQSKIFTKKNTIKRIDLSNRIKAVEDCLTDYLKFDDKHFFKIIAEKVLSDDEKEKVDARICRY